MELELELNREWHDTLSRVSKAGRVPVDAAMSVAEAFATIASSCARHFRRNEPLVIAERNPAALHQTRVALRRLRSAFSLFRSAVADAEFERLRDELRWFTGRLGDARNLDVFLERDLSPDERARVERERDAAYEQVIETMESPRYRLLMFDIVGWSMVGEWRSNPIADKPVEPYVRRRIDRLWAKVHHAHRLAHLSDQERHRLRIRSKKLRYALEFVSALHASRRKERKKFGTAVQELQEALGLLNDLAIAQMLVDAELSTDAAESEPGERALLNDAEQALDRMRAVGPYWRD